MKCFIFRGEIVILEKSIRTNSKQLHGLKQKNLNPQNFSVQWEDWQHLVWELGNRDSQKSPLLSQSLGTPGDLCPYCPD